MLELPEKLVTIVADESTLEEPVNGGIFIKFYNKRKYSKSSCINTFKNGLSYKNRVSPNLKVNIIELDNKGFELSFKIEDMFEANKYINYRRYIYKLSLEVKHPQLPKASYSYNFLVDNKMFPQLIQLVSASESSYGKFKTTFCYDPINNFFIPDVEFNIDLIKRKEIGKLLLSNTPEPIKVGNTYLLEVKKDKEQYLYKNIFREVEVLGFFPNVAYYKGYSDIINCIPEEFELCISNTYSQIEKGPAWLFFDIITKEYILYYQPTVIKGILLGPNTDNRTLTIDEFADLSFKNSWILTMNSDNNSEENKEKQKSIIIKSILDQLELLNCEVYAYNLKSMASKYGSVRYNLKSTAPDEIINILKENIPFDRRKTYGTFGDLFENIFDPNLFSFSQDELFEIIKTALSRL